MPSTRICAARLRKSRPAQGRDRARCDLAQGTDGVQRKLVDAVESATKALGYSHRRITSGAGHDACNLANVVPSAMIFVPCKDGVSHNELEDANPGRLRRRRQCADAYSAALAWRRILTINQQREVLRARCFCRRQ
jgi:acetylornithine deacetylase/succinyl-diaminopimelate desuccinylase-like protein